MWSNEEFRELAARRDNTRAPLPRALCWHCSLASSPALVEKGCRAGAGPWGSCSRAWQDAHDFGMIPMILGWPALMEMRLRLHWQCWVCAQKCSLLIGFRGSFLLTPPAQKKGRFHVHANLNFWRCGRGKGVGESYRVTFTQTVDEERLTDES